ncbi:hypothetical protein [Saccharopolyspora griseoalba]|uniref:Uncharacterized protein n=1 Tax=Saccharopolyspora griseoalba TaxID=1431848 RepID=A0ABW2LLJ1_9PSEU
MAIDRAGRARRRWEKRAAEGARPEPLRSAGVALGVEGLFSAGAKHQLDQLAYVEVVKDDERESGGGSLDFESETLRLDSRWD